MAVLACCEATGEYLPTLPLRELAIRSVDVVIAEPAPPRPQATIPASYRVWQVLKGSRVGKGQKIAIHGTDSYRLDGGRGEPSEGQFSSNVSKAVLFLDKTPAGKADGEGFRLVLSGIRCLTADGHVLVPRQFINPGPYYLVADKNSNWDELITLIIAEIPLIDSVLAMERIDDPARRNQAIFAWIEKHRSEFTGSRLRQEPKKAGWGSLEQRTFVWVIESGRPDDAWKALKLYREIGLKLGRHPGYSPEGRSVRSFGSASGRKLLVGIATDSTQPEGDRETALYHLLGSFWPSGHWGEVSALARLSREEQAEIIRKIEPLLKSKSDGIRLRAVEALSRASSPRDATLRAWDTDAALPALEQAYRSEAPGYVRNALATALQELSPDGAYPRLSGNRSGSLVLLYSFSMNTNDGIEKVCFTMYPKHMPEGMSKQPSLVMERLDGVENVIQRKVVPLPVRHPQDIWEKGWKPYSGAIFVEVPSAELAEGNWRFIVGGGGEGTFSPKWRSEPWVFQVKRPRSLKDVPTRTPN